MINHVARLLITASIVNKHRGVPTLERHLEGPLIEHPVHGYLQEALRKPGVFVHWGVYGSGKTVSMHEVSRRLQEEEKRTVVMLNGYRIVRHGNPTRHLRSAIGIPPDFKDPISTFFQRSKLTILIDDFSPVMSVDGVYDLLHELARDSTTNGGYNVLLCVTAFEWAVDLLTLRWEDCACPIRLAGFPGCGRWSEAQLRELVCSTPEKVEAVITSSVRSGVPPFDSRARDVGEARTLDLEWQKGVQALSKLPKESFTMAKGVNIDHATNLGPALYPDKTGMFTLM